MDNNETKSLKNLTDEDLMREFQASNSIVYYNELVKRHKDSLMNFIFKFVGNYDLAEDILQETLIRLYKNKDYYTTIAKVSTWLYTIASNLAKTEIRRRNRRMFFSIYGTNNDGDEDEFDIPDHTDLPDNKVDSSIKNKLINEALSKIQPLYRELVILRDIQELSYEEIAEITKLNLGTVKSRINRGRAKLQKLLKDIYYE